MIDQAQRQGFAIILLDTEGEYTQMNDPTEDPTMLKLLAERGEEPHGVEKTTLYTLAGKRTSNPNHPAKADFDLSFERFSPFVVQELLDLSDAQEVRFSEAYEAAKTLLRELGVFPARNNDEEKRVAMELNEFETGYPRMKLDHIIDVVRMVHDSMYDDDLDETVVMTSDFREARGRLKEKAGQLASKTSHKQSWRALLGHLHRLRRLKVFDAAEGLDYDALLERGHVSIFDLSDSDSPAINNLVIADVLRGVQDRQDEAYRRHEQGGTSPTRVLVIIEEAHEFLSDGESRRCRSSSSRSPGSPSAVASAGWAWSSSPSCLAICRLRCSAWSTTGSCTAFPTPTPSPASVGRWPTSTTRSGSACLAWRPDKRSSHSHR